MIRRIAGVLMAVAVATSIANGETRISLRMQSGDIDFSGAAFTRPVKVGTSLPPICSIGEAFFNTAVVPGQNLYWCISENSWMNAALVAFTIPNTYDPGATQTFSASSEYAGVRIAPSSLPASPSAGDIAVDAGDGNTLKVYNGSGWRSLPTQPIAASTTPGDVLTSDGVDLTWKSPAGDVTGTLDRLKVTGINNRAVFDSDPAPGDTLVWNGTLARWEPKTAVTGKGLLTQTDSGTVARSFMAGTGLIMTNADGQAGNPNLSLDIATSDEARAGIATDKVVTPERVLNAFTAWNPLPSQIGKAYGMLSTNGTTPLWSWSLITPASGTQVLSDNQAQIVADRLFVRIDPASSLTLQSSPVIADGVDGQFLTVANVSATNTLTLQDEAVVPGSNLRLGGGSLKLGPRESAAFVFVAGLGNWVSMTRASESSLSGPAAAADGQISVFNGTSGKALRTFTGTGLLKAFDGIPGVVAGNATDCVKVDGSSGTCGTGDGDVTGPAASAAGQLTLFMDSTGKTLNAANLTGVLKATDGVAAVVAGNSTDLVQVDGSSVAPSHKTVLTWSGSATTNNNTPQFMSPSGGASFHTIEVNRQITLPAAGTLSKLYINKTGWQSSTGSMTCVIRVNEATPAETLSVTFPASGVNGAEVFSDLTHTVNIAAGDRIGLMCTNSATAGTNSAALNGLTILYTMSGGA